MNEKILSEVASVQNFWRGRNTRIDALQQLVIDSRGSPGTPAATNANVEVFTGNDPATDMSLAVHLLSSIPLRHRIHVDPEDNNEQDMAGVSQRTLISLWEELDDARLEAGRDSWLRELAFWLALTGWYAVMPRLEWDGVKPIGMAEIFEPKTIYPKYGEKGLSFLAHIYTTTLEIAREKAETFGQKIIGRESPQTTATIANVWKRVDGEITNQIILLSHKQMIRAEEKMPMKHIPFLTGPSGGFPRYASIPSEYTTSGSLLWANERVYRELDRWRSFEKQLVRDHAQAPYIASGINPDPEDNRKPDLFSQPSILWTPNPNARMSRVNVGGMPVDIQVIDAQYEAMKQRGTFSSLLFGDTARDLAGFTVQQLLGNAYHRLGPFKRVIERVVAKINREWLEGLGRKKTKIGISGKLEHKYFRQEVNTGDLPEAYDLSVELKLALPNDLITRITIARNARGGNDPLLDLDTILDEILEMQDPELVKRRIAEDMAEADPTMLQLKKIISFKKRANELRAEGKTDIADILDELTNSMLQQASGQNKGAQPRGAQGVSPEVLPPEAQGISPDLAQAITSNTQTPSNVPA